MTNPQNKPMCQPLTILETLKSETSELHLRVESRLKGRFESRAVYLDLLRLYYSFYAPLEKKLDAMWDPVSAASLRWTERQKTPWLLKDLEHFGSNADGMPFCEDLPMIKTLSHAYGSLYVLEGATLGGQYIRRTLEQNLRITTIEGRRFFTSYGDHVGAMWIAFRNTLQSFSETHGSATEILAGASQTFMSFDRWLAAEKAT